MADGLRNLDPGDAALLVIDMQNAFCHPEGTLGISGVDISAMAGVIEPVAELVRTCDAAGIPAIWSIQEHVADDRSRGRKRLAPHTSKRARIAAEQGTWDAEIVTELAPLAEASHCLIRKHRYGCFYETNLAMELRILGRRTLLVAGVSANACVDTTIREAYMEDLDVVAVRDCIGAVRADWYQAALEIWNHYFAELADRAAIADWLRSA